MYQLPANPGPGSSSRAPRFWVTVDNLPLGGVLDVEIDSTAHFSADQYRVRCAIAGLDPSHPLGFWSTAYDARLRVSLGLQNPDGSLGSPSSLVLGLIDQVEINPLRGELCLRGRDLSSLLVDAKTTEKFENMTVSNIVSLLGKRHGLIPNVAPVNEDAGASYGQGHVKLTQEQSEWDLLCGLAEQVGYDLWVKDNTLNFQPQTQPGQASPYVLSWSQPGQGQAFAQANFSELRMHCALGVAQDVIVKVRSWNQASAAVFTKTYKMSAACGSRGQGGAVGPKAQLYTFTVPNLDQAGALQLAQQKALEITRHERVIEGSLAGDDILDIRTMVLLQGTNTDFDQTYYLESISRRLSLEQGYSMSFRAKNMSPRKGTDISSQDIAQSGDNLPGPEAEDTYSSTETA